MQESQQTEMNGRAKTTAEFFAGVGLMRIGLENAGWRITFANDIDEDKWQAPGRPAISAEPTE
jgi:hypothetical protein